MTEGIEASPLPSERSFGAVFVVVFTVLAGVAFMRHSAWWIGFAAAGVLTLAVALARPIWLRPLNRQWMRLAALLNTIVSPLVLGVMFFGIFAPVGLAMRLAGRDVLKRRFERAATSYWVDRDPPGPDPKSLPHQF